jgi:subtilisin family serine protease
MSLGGGASSALDSAVRKVVGKGVAVVVAAGNSNRDACLSSPAREPLAITVGATDSLDRRASYSNYGSCLDLFAPGSGIVSTWPSSTSAVATLNGTSMAAPHVAGAVALLLQADVLATPSVIDARLKSEATANAVGQAGTGSPNRLLRTTDGGTTVAPPPELKTVWVSSLTPSAATQRSGWRATVSITVSDGTAGVGGAVVTADFSVGGTGLKCTTSTAGTCQISSGLLGKSVASTRFTVRGVTGSGLSFDANSVGHTATVDVTRP